LLGVQVGLNPDVVPSSLSGGLRAGGRLPPPRSRGGVVGRPRPL